VNTVPFPLKAIYSIVLDGSHFACTLYSCFLIKRNSRFLNDRSTGIQQENHLTLINFVCSCCKEVHFSLLVLLFLWIVDLKALAFSCFGVETLQFLNSEKCVSLPLSVFFPLNNYHLFKSLWFLRSVPISDIRV